MVVPKFAEPTETTKTTIRDEGREGETRKEEGTCEALDQAKDRKVPQYCEYPF